MRRREVPGAKPSNGSATTSRCTARRPTTAWRCSRRRRWRTCARACPATTATTTPATSRRWSPARRRCGWPRSTCPTATRSAPTSSPTSSTWMERLNAPRPRAAGARGAAGAGRRLQRHPRARGRRQPALAGWATRCSSPRPAAAFRALKWLGLTDAYMEADGAPGGYTFWDYQAGAWQRNHGIRIDHAAALAPGRRPAGAASTIHRDARGGTSPPTTCPWWPSWSCSAAPASPPGGASARLALMSGCFGS